MEGTYVTLQSVGSCSQRDYCLMLCATYSSSNKKKNKATAIEIMSNKTYAEKKNKEIEKASGVSDWLEALCNCKRSR